jgi:hypothetical protein
MLGTTEVVPFHIARAFWIFSQAVKPSMLECSLNLKEKSKKRVLRCAQNDKVVEERIFANLR